MNIPERIKQAEDKVKEMSTKFNSLEQEKQDILKEALRLEGELRILKELQEK